MTVYIVLGVLYESYIHPITILSTLPSAGVGALLALMMSGEDLGVIGIIGIILLIGIVKKNAIMMIDFALDAERDEGKPPREAIYQACLLRFRPILMTTMAALLGALPLMLGHRHGLRTAPSARHRHRRRPDRQPGADAVHHAGDLSRLRPAGAAPARTPRVRRAAAGDGQESAAHEHLGALHPAAGRHDPAHARHRSGGRAAFFLLPVSPLPQVDFPTIPVSATLPGASPETMATSVAAPLERHLGQIADVTEMTSQSRSGADPDLLQFDLDRDIDGAARDVQAAINAARADLPASLRQQPDLPQGEPRRRADPDPGADLADADPRADLRRRLQLLQQKHLAGAGRRRRHRRRRSLPAVRVELNPRALSSMASAWRTCVPRWHRPTPTARRARSRRTSAHSRSTPTTRPPRRGLPPLVIAYRNGARGPPRRRRRGGRLGRGHAQHRPLQRQARGAGRSSTASRAPTSSTPSNR